MAARLGVAARPPPAAPVDVTLARQLLQRLLVDNVLPAWGTRLIDPRRGRFALHHDAQWRWKGPAPKRLVSQSRMLWFFSRVSRSRFATPSHELMARHAFDFLRGSLRDPDNGGYFWEVAHDGSAATCGLKQAYGQVFALYALSEYAVASGDETASRLARELFDLMLQHLHDARHGARSGLWRPLQPGLESRDRRSPRAPHVRAADLVRSQRRAGLARDVGVPHDRQAAGPFGCALRGGL
ncbi:MAG: AGE family epimerase/isomerase [Candidatus Eremiobacteraeota bacterium]|nr:AGE family epimerase/isomerase [Candidatus Eremiobacteraeota bacterium]